MSVDFCIFIIPERLIYEDILSDSTLATREKGKILVESAVNDLAELTENLKAL